MARKLTAEEVKSAFEKLTFNEKADIAFSFLWVDWTEEEWEAAFDPMVDEDGNANKRAVEIIELGYALAEELQELS